MAGFGERLRRERELRGIKLEEIAESTKIGARYLRALEDEDLSKLPGGIFSKGFVRAYARYLGIDEEEAIADFVTLAGESETKLPEPPSLPEKPQIEPHHSRWWLVLALVALIAVGFYYGRNSPRLGAIKSRVMGAKAAQPQPEHASPQTITTSAMSPNGTVQAATNEGAAPSAGTSQAAVTSASTPSPEMSPAKDGKIVVDLHTTQQAWVQWSVDDGPTQEATFAPNSEKHLAGNSRVRVKVGDAAAVELTYNGKTLAPLGPSKQVRTLTFTPEGMQE